MWTSEENEKQAVVARKVLVRPDSGVQKGFEIDQGSLAVHAAASVVSRTVEGTGEVAVQEAAESKADRVARGRALGLPMAERRLVEAQAQRSRFDLATFRNSDAGRRISRDSNCVVDLGDEREMDSFRRDGSVVETVLDATADEHGNVCRSHL